MTTPPVLFWFRQDLRLADNPALAAALATGRPVATVYILDEEAAGRWRPGAAARWWLHESLQALARAIADRGGRLVLRRGPAERLLPALVGESGANAVFWNRCYEPHAIGRDRALKESLRRAGVRTVSANAALLREPWELATRAGGPFRIFGPFWEALRRIEALPPAAAEPERLPAPPPLRSESLADLGLLPRPAGWTQGLAAVWQPGEAGAGARLARFLAEGVAGYARDRDRPDRPGTAMLSPHLHWGEIGPRQVWRALHALAPGEPPAAGTAAFLRELGWREFSHHLLYHWPALPDEPLREGFRRFPWRADERALAAWQQGRTGYPMVDAGMRQLWRTGWMHNRARMVCASFLVKHLLLPWQAGEAWFWGTLVDADLAQNAANWQWVAGCGADAAPYFRIFNPTLQGRRFDPEGRYVRRWVPALAGLPGGAVHEPWRVPPALLAEAGVALGKTYPPPLVDHAAARARALEAYRSLRAGG